MTTWNDYARALWLRMTLPFVQTVPQARVLELDCFTPEAKSLLRATFRRAAFFGSTLAGSRHLLVECLEREPLLGKCIEAMGLELDVIRDALAAPLGDERDGVEMGAVDLVRADRVLWAICVHTREIVRFTGKPAHPIDLANVSLFDPRLRGELESFGVSIAQLNTFVAHGVLEHAPIPEDAFAQHEELDVWLDNDDRTTQDFVVDVLTNELDLEPAEASRLMLQVHEQGSARVDTFVREDAIAAANAVLERARLAGFPLRVRVEPPSPT